MEKYEFIVTKKLVGHFTVDADSESAARAVVRDHAHRIVLVDNVSPWDNESIEEVLVGKDSDDAFDAYVQGVWDTVAYVNENYMSEDNLLKWEQVLKAIEQEELQENGR